MKIVKFFVAGLVAALVTGCTLSSNGMVDLDPIPYSFHPTNALESKLSVEPMTGDWANDVYAAGVESAAVVNYTPDQGNSTILMGVYYMPESVFDGAVNPNEPPLYGTQVARSNGFVLAVAGPQDSIYDPESPDGINIGHLYEALYNPESYVSK